MYSKEYERAKKELVNCMVFGIVGLGVPFVIAYKEWWPIMCSGRSSGRWRMRARRSPRKGSHAVSGQQLRPPASGGGPQPFLLVPVKGRVDGVDIFLIHPLRSQTQGFAEALEMDHLAFPEETDDVVDIRIVAQAENVVIGGAGLLLCCDFIRTTFFRMTYLKPRPSPPGRALIFSM